MSTRSKTRLAAASTSKLVTSVPSKQDQKPKKPTQSVKLESDQLEKENVKVKTLNGPTKASSTRRKASKPATPMYCVCQRGDDGSPMVYCGGCRVWYHFTCVDLTEEDAEEINVYICPACTEVSGRRTAMVWEGQEALEEFSDAEPIRQRPSKKQSSAEPRPKRPAPVHMPSESEEDISSEDEYVAEEVKSKIKNKKRPIRHPSSSSESELETDDDTKRNHGRPGKPSGSPAPGRRLKRKTEHASHTPPTKRKKPSEASATDDPVRKYCLAKLEELFRDIFFRYPYVRVEKQENEGSDKKYEPDIVKKSLDELTEEEKAHILAESKDFAVELEKCVYDTYSELDKQGRPSAGSNYKDRFRMLQFNLSKVDRVVIHERIASSLITPKEISLMSSTDLANEETKQSIKIAEKEALEYSILTPTTVPRAKITHKGLEDIEDIHGESTYLHEQERSRIEDEERRERERTARQMAQKRQRTTSLSVPPESPLVRQEIPSWGAPPPVPIYASSPGKEPPSPTTFHHERSPVDSLSRHTLPDHVMAEPEINLADFINMDDDIPSAADETQSPPIANQTTANDTTLPHVPTTPSTVLLPHPTPTGISPFAAKPETPTSTSFNLDALWSVPTKAEVPALITSLSPTVQGLSPSEPTPPTHESPKDMAIDPETVEADDQDFDMFLDEKDQVTSVESLQAAFDALPQVWVGKINMPLDSTIPQETPVIARQMGGRSLAHDSLLWKTLFPSDLLRIDGRVPVENSSKFLLQMRMNVAKELIAVTFSPAPDSSDVGFRLLSDFLIAKGRHGLVFPWGNRPKDYHPGRELYIIPLLSSDPLPDYMELLDDLRLPKIRKSNYLIGIWILNKGKLAPPPAPPTTTVVPQIPTNIQLPVINAPPPLPPIPAPNPPPPPLPAAIAAEVASLTPEQIQLMIQTLSGNAPIPLPIPPPPQNPPPSQPHIPPPAPSQPWSHPSRGFGGAAYHPPPNPHPQSHHTPPHGHSPYNRRDYGPSRPGGYDRGGDRGDRGWRGRGRGRGRGTEVHQKPLDSGWPRKPRNDEAGPSSPTRRW